MTPRSIRPHAPTPRPGGSRAQRTGRALVWCAILALPVLTAEVGGAAEIYTKTKGVLASRGGTAVTAAMLDSACYDDLDNQCTTWKPCGTDDVWTGPMLTNLSFDRSIDQNLELYTVTCSATCTVECRKEPDPRVDCEYTSLVTCNGLCPPRYNGWGSCLMIEGVDRCWACGCSMSAPTGACTSSDPADEGPGAGSDGGGDGSGGETDPTPLPDGGTPVILDLDAGSIRLTAEEDGVWFDLDADGVLDHVAWTRTGALDGFLALDRDGNGSIDHGGELFGDASPQPTVAEPHGYLALAVFDAAAQGGNEDGLISAADPVFGSLVVWVDGDHDGRSAPGELYGLQEAGVLWIDLRYVENRRRDRHGNSFRYSALVGMAGGRRTVSYDVFLRTAAP